jgi:HflK protein
MVDFLLRVLWETWNIFKQASIFLLFGFLLAGVLAVLVPEKALSKLFRKGKVKSVLWAAAIGAPLPLCSCGVVPAALGLRRQGATPGATAAFLIATPETGVDSISLSYALTDLTTTIFRPVAAVMTAVTAGICINLFGTRRTPRDHAVATPSSVEEVAPSAANVHDSSHAHSHPHPHDHSSDGTPATHEEGHPVAIGSGLGHAASRVYHYAFRQLLDDTSYWVLLGIVLSAIVAASLPPTFFEQYLSNEFVSMLVMLAVSLPIYVCASEATPVAAALVLKGLSPGAALVFLLAGPATNIGSLVVLTKFLGARIMAIYLASIVVITLLAGFALNWVYRTWGLDPRATFGAATSFIPEPVKIGGALLLIVLLVLSMRRTAVPGEWLWVRDRIASLTGLRLTAARLALAVGATLAVLYLGSGLFAVPPGEVGVTTRFGRIVSSELSPGLHYRLPWPFEAHRIIPTERVQRIEFGVAGNPARTGARPVTRERMNTGGNPMPEAFNTNGTWFQKEGAPEEPFLLTGDGNLIDLRWALQYRVKDPVAFAFNIAEPDAFVRGASLAALRGVVARSGIDAIYTSERSSVEQQVARAIQDTLDRTRTGVEVLTFHLLYVHAPEEVHDAFRDVASAQEDKLRTINRANIFAVETVNQAKGEAAATIEQALAFKEQQIKHAQGDAASFLLRLGAYRRAPELTKFRLQVETIEETLPGLQKFVRPGAGEMKDFDMWLLQPVGTSKSK